MRHVLAVALALGCSSSKAPAHERPVDCSVSEPIKRIASQWCASDYCDFGQDGCEAMRDRMREPTEPCRYVDNVACFTDHTGGVSCFASVRFCNARRALDDAPQTACRYLYPLDGPCAKPPP